MLKRSSVLLVLLLAACGGGASKEPDRGGDSAAASSQQSGDLLAGIQTKTLPNGLKVLVKEDFTLPIVATAIGFKVGSVDESESQTGLSHFLEHMLFKGTDKYQRGQIDRITFEAGGANNAFTSNDMTVYWFHVAADKLDEFLAIEANRMKNCTMDAMEFENEKAVVLEELNIDLDSPWGPLEQEMEKTVFTNSGYRHPVLGWRADLDKMTRDAMVAHYRTYYQPNNAILVIVGAVKAADAFEKVAKHFEKVEAGPTPPAAKGKEPPQDGERRFSLTTEDSTARLLMAYRSDVVGTKEDIVLDVISTILSTGKKSRLNARLVEKDDLVSEGGVSTLNYARKYDGVFYLQVELKPGAKPEAAEKSVLEELERLKNAPVDAKELERAKNILRAGFAFGKETTIDLATAIVQYEVLNVPNYLREYMDRIWKVTADDIRQVAAKIFDAKRRSVGTANPKKSDKDGYRAVPRREKHARHSRALQAEPELGEFWEVRLSNGLTLLAKRKANVPVVSVQAFVRAGALYESDHKAGVATLTGELLDEGIRDEKGGRVLDHEQIAGIIEDVGGTLSTGASGVSVKVLSEHRHLAYDLARDLLIYPTFPNERFKKLRQDQLAEIESMDDDPRSVARRLFLETIYPGHPSRRPAVGYASTVEKLTRDDVVAHHRRFFRPDNTIVAVVGDIDPAAALKDLAARFGGWKGEGDVALPEIPAIARQTEPRQKFEFRRKLQVNVYFGHVSIARNDPDYAALKLAEYILCTGSGFTDRMSMKVRDQGGFAYAVGGTITGSAGEAPGPFIIYLGTKAEKKDDALSVAMKELQDFVENGPTEAEVESAKQYLARNVVFDWEDSGSMAGALIELRRFHLPADHLRRFVKSVRSMTAADVKRAAQKHLDPKNLSLVIVGPVDKDGKVIKVDDK